MMLQCMQRMNFRSSCMETSLSNTLNDMQAKDKQCISSSHMYVHCIIILAHGRRVR